MRQLCFKRFLCWITLVAFLVSGVTPAYAQGIVSAFDLPKPGVMVNVSAGYVAPMLRGLNVDAKQPFKFDFILDTGNSDLTADTVKDEANKLIRYFLVALTMPEKDLWVNLSPYEKDRIINDELSITEMGRDMLAQDYMLKQITASMIYPENETGKAFWNKVYEKAYALYGTTDIPTDTFNKVWIVPDKAVVYENGTKVFVVESSMKVMLDTDYLAVSAQASLEPQKKDQEKGDISRDILREVVVPILEKEVNEGQNFSQLRQIYHSLILAKWYKDTLKESILNKKYSDQKKVRGVDLQDKNTQQEIYAQYLQAFQKGVFNYVKEEYDKNSAELIPRKYFSGGIDYSEKITLKKIFALSRKLVRLTGTILNVSAKVAPPSAEDEPVESAPVKSMTNYRDLSWLQAFLHDRFKGVSSPERFSKNVLESVIKSFKDKKDFVVVDAGCGTGSVLNQIAKVFGVKKSNLFGIDKRKMTPEDLEKIKRDMAGPHRVDQMRDELDQYLDQDTFTFVQDDITTVRLPKPADLILSFFVLQYVEDPLAAFANLFNQLNEGGFLMAHLLVPYRPELFNMYQALVTQLQKQGIKISLFQKSESLMVGDKSSHMQHLVFVADRGKKDIKVNVKPVEENNDVPMLLEDGREFMMKAVRYPHMSAGQTYVTAVDAAEPMPFVHDQVMLKNVEDAIAQTSFNDLGGIDFNTDRMDLQRTGQRSDLDWAMSNADLADVQINGLTPVIIQITPVEDLPALLGASH